MNTTSTCITRLRRRLRLATVAMPALVGVALLAGTTVHAKPVPENLGNGLGKLVESNLAVTSAKKTGTELSGAVTVNGKTYTDAITADIADKAISDAKSGRVMVRITLDGKVDVATLSTTLARSIASVTVTSIDTKYRGVGIMNAYVDVADVAVLSQIRGVAAVILELKPRHNQAYTAPKKTPTVLGGDTGLNPSATVGEVMTKLGTDFDQGVTQHRVDQINQYYNPSATLDYEGTGMHDRLYLQQLQRAHREAGDHGCDQLRPARRGDQPGQHHAGVRLPG